MRAARAIALLAALGACRGGGGDQAPPPPAAEASSSPSAAPEAPERIRGPRTTNGAIATRNLDAQIRGAEALAEQQPGKIDQQARLIELLKERGAYLGRFSDLGRALELAEALVQRAPKEPRAYAARAGARAALHRFQGATEDLDKAAALGERPEALEGARAAILEAQGRLDEALPLRRRAREARATLATLGAEAALLGEMGQTAEAERRFAEALEAYRDVSPFPVAWLHFERGMMWERLGELDRARPLYAEAHARLPLHAHAAAHLAGLEPPSRAVEILEPIVQSSDDPQYMAQLAEAKRLGGAPDGAALLDRARERFEELERLYPEAVVDHAGWFWLGPGKDPARALARAKANEERRKNAAAYELLIEAARAAGQKDKACEAADEGLKLRYRTPKLLDVAASALAGCGKIERAAEVRQAARSQGR